MFALHKMTFHTRYIDKISDIVLYGICRVVAVEIFKGIF